MQGVKTLLLIAALIYCAESRERLGKVIYKRQARNRDFRAILAGSPSNVVPSAVVVDSFGRTHQDAQQFGAPGSPQRISVGSGVASQVRPVNQQSQFNVQQPQVAQQFQQLPQQAQFKQQQTQFQQQQQFQQQPVQQAQFQQQQPQQFQQQVQQAQGLSSFGALQSQRQVSNYQQAAVPSYQKPATNFNSKPLINQVYQQAPQYSQLISIKDRSSNRIVDRLISNATLIRPNIVDGFSCQGRKYGYYADVLNDCQIFHVCYPLRQIFPGSSVPDITYEFSFICNEFTRFSQDSLTCAWQYEAVPCEHAESLYIVNDEFFKTTVAPPPAAVPAAGGAAYGNVAPLPDSRPI